MLKFWGAGKGKTYPAQKIVAFFGINPSDAIWHHIFNFVLHMLKFWGAGKG
jgi:hypothetical protein